MPLHMKPRYPNAPNQPEDPDQPEDPVLPDDLSALHPSNGERAKWLGGNKRMREIIWARQGAKKATMQSDNQTLGSYELLVGRCSACLIWFPTQALQVDHIIPYDTLRHIAGNDPDELVRMNNDTKNLTFLCGSCNASKSNHMFTRWLGHLLQFQGAGQQYRVYAGEEADGGEQMEVEEDDERMDIYLESATRFSLRRVVDAWRRAVQTDVVFKSITTLEQVMSGLWEGNQPVPDGNQQGYTIRYPLPGRQRLHRDVTVPVNYSIAEEVEALAGIVEEILSQNGHHGEPVLAGDI